MRIAGPGPSLLGVSHEPEGRSRVPAAPRLVRPGPDHHAAAGPFTPGQTIQVTLFNNLTFNLGLPCGDPLWLQQNDGSPAVYPWSSDCSFSFPPGTSVTLPFTIPVSGPGSSGSYVFRSHYAAVRMDVGLRRLCSRRSTASRSGSQHLAVLRGLGGLEHDRDVAHVRGGRSDPDLLARRSRPGRHGEHRRLDGAGQLHAYGLSAARGTSSGPYTVEMAWNDPLTGLFTTLRHGIQHDGGMELRLRGGHVIPSGGILPVELRTWGFPYASSPTYALCIGVLPGSTPVPGGRLFPLVADPAVLASLADGIGGS